MLSNGNIKNLEQAIKQAKSIAIMGHHNPDGDSLGSTIWLWEILKKLGKKVEYFSDEEISKFYSFVKETRYFKTEFKWKFDLIILCDLNEPARTGFDIFTDEFIKSNFFIIIDHHIYKEEIWQINILEPNASSTSEIIFEIIEKLRPEKIDNKIATNLLLGLIYDTDCFRHPNTTPKTFEVASKLIANWADKQFLIEKFYKNNSFGKVRFTSIMIQRAVLKNKIIYTYYDETELKDYDTDKESIKDILPILMSIKKVSIALLFKKDWEKLTCSVRSKENLSQKIASHFGGWGHIKAAGFMVEAKDDIQKQFTEIIKNINDIL